MTRLSERLERYLSGKQKLKALNAFSPTIEASRAVISGLPDPKSDDTRDVTERIQTIAFYAEGGQIENVSDRDLQLALQVLDSPPLSSVPGSPEIFIDEAVRRDSRRLSRSLYRAYLNQFDPGERLTAQLAAAVANCLDRLPLRQRQAIERHELLDYKAAPTRVSNLAMSGKDPSAEMDAIGLWRDLQTSAFACAAMHSGAHQVTEACQAGDLGTLEKYTQWVTQDSHAVSGVEGALMRSLLLPFAQSAPPEPIKAYLVQFFLKVFGDPRLSASGWPNVSGDDGEGVRTAAISVVMRWLAAEFLELFIKIIDETAAERMWDARKKFWLPYFENDHVSNITLILSSEADYLARTMQRQNENLSHLTWSRLKEALPNQSVLLMQIGDLTIAEWSHSGKIRFWRQGYEQGPKFHAQVYRAYSLRNRSYRFKLVASSKAASDGITHDPTGRWREKARKLIYKQTGIKP